MSRRKTRQQPHDHLEACDVCNDELDPNGEQMLMVTVLEDGEPRHGVVIHASCAESLPRLGLRQLASGAWSR